MHRIALPASGRPGGDCTPAPHPRAAYNTSLLNRPRIEPMKPRCNEEPTCLLAGELVASDTPADDWPSWTDQLRVSLTPKPRRPRGRKKGGIRYE